MTVEQIEPKPKQPKTDGVRNKMVGLVKTNQSIGKARLKLGGAQSANDFKQGDTRYIQDGDAALNVQMIDMEDLEEAQNRVEEDADSLLEARTYNESLSLILSQLKQTGQQLFDANSFSGRSQGRRDIYME